MSTGRAGGALCCWPRRLSSGVNHSLVLCNDGLYSFGEGKSGQLGYAPEKGSQGMPRKIEYFDDRKVWSAHSRACQRAPSASSPLWPQSAQVSSHHKVRVLAVGWFPISEGRKKTQGMHGQSSDGLCDHGGGSPVLKNHPMTVLPEQQEPVRLYRRVLPPPPLFPQKQPQPDNQHALRGMTQPIGRLCNRWKI